jgi:hypothetical protein
VPAVALDRNLFEQALLNIAKNAVEARKRAHASAACRGASIRAVREGERLRLAVVDSGRSPGRSAARADVHALLQHQERRPGHRPCCSCAKVLQRHGLQYRLAPDGPRPHALHIWLPP